MPLTHKVLLVLGVLMAAKALWGAISPESFRKGTAWWMKKVRHVNTLTGIAGMIVGVLLLVVILLKQPLVVWLLGVFGVLAIYGGSMYLRFDDLERHVKTMILNRPAITIRIVSVLGVILAGWVIYVAIFS